MNLILVTAVIYSLSAWFDYCCFFLMGISVTARYYVGLTYNLEMATDAAQVYVTTIYFVGESMISLFICYYFSQMSNDWIPLMYPNLGFTLLGIVCLALFPESPRYYVARRQFSSARQVFKTIAKWNRVEPAVDVDSFVFESELEICEPGLADKKPSWRDIWRDPAYRKNLIAASVLYITATFNGYLLTFYLKYFPGNIYENAAIQAVSDLVAFIMAGVMLKCTSIGIGLRVSAILAGAGGCIYLVFSTNLSFVPITVCLARVGITMLFNICLISVNRLFLTQNVTTAYGVVNFVSHIFTCFSPMIAEIPNPFPFIIFEALVVIGFFASFFIRASDDIQKQKKALLASEDEIDKTEEQ